MGKELDVETEILEWLNDNNFFAWKNHNLSVYDSSTRSYRKPNKYQIKGVPDIIAQSKHYGTLFIEVKSMTGVQSREQKAFEATLKLHGGKYLLVNSLANLMGQLNDL